VFGGTSLVLGVVAALVLWTGGPLGVGVLAMWVSAAFGGAALAYAGAGPRLFGKRDDGSVPVWSYVVMGPFLVFGRAGLRVFNATGLESPWSAIDDGVWLGRRPHGPDVPSFQELAPIAVLDMAAEVARSRGLTGHEIYLTLPTLDNAAPAPDQLDAGVAFIEMHRQAGPVYVHCALGNGRAATITAAWLLSTGRAEGVVDAERQLKALRPSVGLSSAQRSGLEAWWTRA
jgi:hypothetical protein